MFTPYAFEEQKLFDVFFIKVRKEDSQFFYVPLFFHGSKTKVEMQHGIRALSHVKQPNKGWYYPGKKVEMNLRTKEDVHDFLIKSPYFDVYEKGFSLNRRKVEKKDIVEWAMSKFDKNSATIKQLRVAGHNISFMKYHEKPNYRYSTSAYFVIDNKMFLQNLYAEMQKPENKNTGYIPFIRDIVSPKLTKNDRNEVYYYCVYANNMFTPLYGKMGFESEDEAIKASLKELTGLFEVQEFRLNEDGVVVY